MNTGSIYTHNLAIIIRGTQPAGSEHHTARLIRYLATTSLRVIVYQVGYDLRQIGAIGIPGKIDILYRTLPTTNVSSNDLRAWREFIGAGRAPVMLVVKTSHMEYDLQLLGLFRRVAQKLACIEHCNLPELVWSGPRVHHYVVPGIGFWWFKERFRRMRLFRIPDVTISVSRASRQAFIDREFAPPRRVVAVTNGVDAEFWRRRPSDGDAWRASLGIPADAFLFGTVNRLDGWKRTDLAIRSFGLLARGVQGVRLAVVGEGPCKAALEALVASLGLGGKVMFTGYTADVRSAYSGIDTLMVTSTRMESCCLAAMEALASGCGLVGSSVGVIPELIESPDLVESEDPAVWAQAMQFNMQRSLADRSALAEARIARIRQSYDERRQFQALVSLLLPETSI